MCRELASEHLLSFVKDMILHRSRLGWKAFVLRLLCFTMLATQYFSGTTKARKIIDEGLESILLVILGIASVLKRASQF